LHSWFCPLCSPCWYGKHVQVIRKGSQVICAEFQGSIQMLLKGFDLDLLLNIYTVPRYYRKCAPH
jgi:hypothetical protein